ncbi:PREDICTED: uncharacterized protein LOC108763763 [Trachymyrmex cornetzi]|uniref:uncharacterized protein LOC108763763 n=1 Tax=Trachymyrmex cornetzi TaxID=471704 RepID=UPI00084F6210|nr:PREDICTED: uncharacterized protein LOC108763763 [Trachymyrmex cornetzi]
MAAAWWLLQLAEEEERNMLKIRRRQLRDASNPFEILESQFIHLYRLTKDATLALRDFIQPHMQVAIRLTAIPLELKLLATLSFLSSGSYQRRIGQDFLSCMCQSSVSGAIHQIIHALNAIMPQWITFPTEHDEIQTIQQTYFIHTNFPGIAQAQYGLVTAVLITR